MAKAKTIKNGADGNFTRRLQISLGCSLPNPASYAVHMCHRSSTHKPLENAH